jgi:hypothetical protein
MSQYKASKRRLSAQQRWGQAVERAVDRGRKMTNQELYDQVEATCGWVDPERTRKAYAFSYGLQHLSRWVDPERTRKAYGLPPKS